MASSEEFDGAPEWSEELPPLAMLVASLTEGFDEDPEDSDDTGALAPASLEEIRVALAVEIEVRDAGEKEPRVTGSTPTQWTETSVLPTFHRMAISVTRSRDA